ncbi:MAG: hypothetical protein GY707_05535 [Desulfobacteraceae bacterium]|nr:hypothetical protein [Desulfobacteraceae bacterium]
MNKRYALHKLYEFGDAIISMKDGTSFLATTDFKNEHIWKIRRYGIENLLKSVLPTLTKKDIAKLVQMEQVHILKDEKAIRKLKMYELMSVLRGLVGRILVFNWTDNKYEVVYNNEIVYMTPLAKVLNNAPRDIS